MLYNAYNGGAWAVGLHACLLSDITSLCQNRKLAQTDTRFEDSAACVVYSCVHHGAQLCQQLFILCPGSNKWLSSLYLTTVFAAIAIACPAPCCVDDSQQLKEHTRLLHLRRQLRPLQATARTTFPASSWMTATWSSQSTARTTHSPLFCADNCVHYSQQLEQHTCFFFCIDSCFCHSQQLEQHTPAFPDVHPAACIMSNNFNNSIPLFFCADSCAHHAQQLQHHKPPLFFCADSCLHYSQQLDRHTQLLLCRQEQEVLEFAARQEHAAALAAVAAASKAAKQDLQHMHEARRRLAWRMQRWRMAQLRRTAIQVRISWTRPVWGVQRGVQETGGCRGGSGGSSFAT